MAQVAAIAKLTAAEGKGEELKAVIADLVAAVRDGEPGTLVYAASQDASDADVFWFYELYESQETAAAHSSGTALADRRCTSSPRSPRRARPAERPLRWRDARHLYR